MNRIDAKTPATEFSWLRAVAYGVLMMLAWLLIGLIVTLLTPWDNTQPPGVPFGIAMGIALEYIRRNDVRKKQR